MYNWYNHAGTQRRYRKLVAEVVKVFGVPVKYMVSTENNTDHLFGEDIAIQYTTLADMKLFLENSDFFQGNHQVYDVKGLTFNDEMTFTVEITQYQTQTGMERPGAGDLIAFSLASAKTLYNKDAIGYSFYKVIGVEEKKTYYQFGTLMMFELHCSKWNYGHEVVDTGNNAIDSVNDLHDAINNGSIGIGEVVKDIDATGNPHYDKATNKHKKTPVITNIDPNDPFGDN